MKAYMEIICDRDVADELFSYPTNRVDVISYDEHILVDNGRKYDIKMVTRGRCMMCGKDLTEGLFFCKECEEKARLKMFEADEYEGCWNCVHESRFDTFKEPCHSCYGLSHYERKDCVCDATIEEHIKQLKKLKSFHNGSYGASINFAIDTMRKYQQIVRIYQKWNEVNDFSYNQAMQQIGEVLEDGNDD